jgi:hypothetical protein
MTILTYNRFEVSDYTSRRKIVPDNGVLGKKRVDVG